MVVDKQTRKHSAMKTFDPIEDVENCQQILDYGKWPNFHDAKVHNLRIWRGDVRPEDNVWIGPRDDDA
jgi:hypothetical protein